MSCSYDEICVFEGIAERTGNFVERAAARGAAKLCSSMNQLGAVSRRMGDGLYYLAPSAWPDDTETVDLNRSWTTLG